MIPVGTVHRAEVRGEFQLAFKCRHCGERANARGRATGTGEATGILLATRPADLAKQRAKASLPGDARELIDLARCPKCAKRGARGIRGWWLVNVVQIAFVLGIFVAAPMLLFRFAFGMTEATTSWTPVVAVPILAMAYLVGRFLIRLRQVDRSVSFDA